ncbi:MAG: alpha/beta hydrolase [Syntrophomonadaceae bacterium]|jgi:pimeloyl-ACP methyl ester carboxylesterase
MENTFDISKRYRKNAKKSESKLNNKKHLLFRVIIIFFLVITIGTFGISACIGWFLTHPVRKPVITTPDSLALNYENIKFTSRGDNLTLKGWLIPASQSKKTIIFAHGYSNNRLQSDVPLLPIVKAVVNEGYNVLMFDFRNSGESEGHLTSVGEYEVNDLLGAIDYVKAKPEISEEIILFGFSMGASTAILAGAREPSVTGVIADSPFSDLKVYLDNNLAKWTHLPPVPFNQAFLAVVPILTDLKPGTVSPVREISQMNNRPVLLIHGESDMTIPLENSEILQSAYPRAQFLRIPKAQHIQCFATNQDLYFKTLFAFLERLI